MTRKDPPHSPGNGEKDAGEPTRDVVADPHVWFTVLFSFLPQEVIAFGFHPILVSRLRLPSSLPTSHFRISSCPRGRKAEV
jgi:hypothetical protein